MPRGSPKTHPQQKHTKCARALRRAAWTALSVWSAAVGRAVGDADGCGGKAAPRWEPQARRVL